MEDKDQEDQYLSILCENDFLLFQAGGKFERIKQKILSKKILVTSDQSSPASTCNIH